MTDRDKLAGNFKGDVSRLAVAADQIRPGGLDRKNLADIMRRHRLMIGIVFDHDLVPGAHAVDRLLRTEVLGQLRQFGPDLVPEQLSLFAGDRLGREGALAPFLAGTVAALSVGTDERLARAGGPTWSFTDGPITANNPMGIHHAWGRTYKDLFQRYKAMRGYDLRWQNGFDCQGLWVEVNVERDLGFKTKRDIEDYGLAPFVVLCKQRVLNYAAVQTEQSMRLGMWMDWNDPAQLRLLSEKLGEDPNSQLTLPGPRGPVTGTVEQLVGQLGLPQMGGSYFTFSDKNNYDIWSFLKKCADSGWLYKGTDVMPWCWRCGTGLSQHEIVTEGYIEKQDPGLTVKFPLSDRPGESLLVWTTTPWTLSSNVAAAVGPDLTYVQVKQGDETLYLSQGTTKMLKGPFQIVRELKGKEMEGWKYTGPFDEFAAAHEIGGWSEPGLRRLFTHIPQTAIQAHRVILWDHVGEAEGTGIVHIAPGCGEEDFQLHKQYALPVIAPLDENGNYIEGFGWLTGLHVSEVTDPIIDNLKSKGLFYRIEKYTHRYPQCWRCSTPLVFRLVDEWFISADGVRERALLEAAGHEVACASTVPEMVMNCPMGASDSGFAPGWASSAGMGNSNPARRHNRLTTAIRCSRLSPLRTRESRHRRMIVPPEVSFRLHDLVRWNLRSTGNPAAV